MGQQFCTECGAKLAKGTRFCESCGAPVEQVTPSADSSPAPGTIPQNPPVPETGVPGRFPVRIIAGIIILLIIAAVAVLVLLPKLQDGTLPGLGGQQPAPTPTIIATPVPVPETVVTTALPTPPPDPFPEAYAVGELFYYNNESKYTSRATVYRYWMNETYQWHNDMDNKYYTEPGRPNPDYKYLLIFVNIENLGSDAYPYPKSNMIVVHNGGNLYRVDTSHYLPDKAGNPKATAVEIQEIEHMPDYFNFELVEDYGYSHGTTQDFVFPGKGNAVDGYLIYNVPATLSLENTYVEIVFDGQDRAVWKLA